MRLDEMTCMECMHGGGRQPELAEMWGFVECKGLPRPQYVTLDPATIAAHHPRDVIERDPHTHSCRMGEWEAVDRPYNRFLEKNQAEGFGRITEEEGSRE